MGFYAEAVRASFPGADGSPALPADTGWVVLLHADVPPDGVRRLFPTPPRVLVLTPTTTQAGSEELGVHYARIEHGPPPRLADAAREALREHAYGAAVLWDGVSITSGRVLLELQRCGVRRVAWREGSRWQASSPRRVALGKPILRVERRIQRTPLVAWYRRRMQRALAHRALRERNTQSFHGERVWCEHSQRVAVRPLPHRPGEPLRVVLYIGQLNSGGAERQLCNLAVALRRKGHSVRVLTTYPLADEDAHYAGDLLAAGIRPEAAGGRVKSEARRALVALGVDPELVGSLPELIRDPVLDLAGELLADPPHLLHCWLDYPNVIGAAAAALVGTPHVILSTRNVNPTYFPAFYQAWMDTWYRYFTTLPQVHLLANSRQGAEDYARWLDLDDARFSVIRNGVDLASLREPAPAEVAAVRRQLGAAPGQPVVAGVFRLAAEKQPVLFLDVISRVRSVVPELKVALVGVGELREEVRRQIAGRYLDQVVVLLGQRKDVPAIFRAADVALLTSAVEGTPNVILEAQAMGCPPVATAVGGTPEALRDGKTGFLHGVRDVSGLSRSVVRLLRDRTLRRKFGRAGKDFVRKDFSLQRMLDETLAYYDSLLEESAPPPPVVAATVSSA